MPLHIGVPRKLRQAAKLAKWPTIARADHVSKSFRQINRHAWYLSCDAISAVQIGNSPARKRTKNASRACDENSAEKTGKNCLFQYPENSKKSREALSGGRYNLKHFVTARGR
ncbi:MULTISPECIES: hypothetical protein [Burkholderia]|uniref:Uncharacterized protein n=1 Tax=Burkholderia anthina TaxID=179879 RepID=A0A7T6VEY8_9BURK|nr:MULTISPECIES: hypothetical protein [Burkholderia]MBY4867985.1 hypothetical protein [Burkholderia anthina]QQK02705.1 hypothetical protein JFN94_00520 [Burkholderia anthina]